MGECLCIYMCGACGEGESEERMLSGLSPEVKHTIR